MLISIGLANERRLSSEWNNSTHLQNQRERQFLRSRNQFFGLWVYEKWKSRRRARMHWHCSVWRKCQPIIRMRFVFRDKKKWNYAIYSRIQKFVFRICAREKERNTPSSILIFMSFYHFHFPLKNRYMAAAVVVIVIVASNKLLSSLVVNGNNMIFSAHSSAINCTVHVN